MASDVPAALRRLVAERARHRCEYCLLHEDDAATSHHIDHIISRKHGGRTQAANLALACIRCNARKGSDVASVSQGGALTRLFHPRQDSRRVHFRLEEGEILGLTDAGTTTARLLRLNDPDRVAERRLLALSGRYPG